MEKDTLNLFICHAHFNLESSIYLIDYVHFLFKLQTQITLITIYSDHYFSTQKKMLHGLKMKCNMHDYDEFESHGHHHDPVYDHAYIYDDIYHYDDVAIDGDDDDDDDYDYAPAASMEGNGNNDDNVAPPAI